MAKQRVVTPWGESWVDDTQTPAPVPAPVQKFTPIDVQTKAQDAIAPKYTQNLLNTQEQATQKAPAPVAQQPQQTAPVVSPVSQQETQPSTMAQKTQTTPQQPLHVQSSPQQNIPQKSAMPPAYQDKVWIPTLPWQTAPQQSTAAPISDNFYDPSNFMYTWMSKQQYDLLDPQNKIQALQTWENFLKQRQGIQWQAEKFAEYTRQKEYLTQQNEIKWQMTWLQEQNAKIQSEQQLRSSQQAVNNLEQNLWFLGSQWKPAVFKQAMEAMKFQMFDAQRLHSELVTMQENGQKLRDLGIEFDENQFNKQMQDMEMAMNDQVDRSIQQALQGFNAQMMLWEIDTPAKLNALTNKWLDSIDMDVTNITNRQMWMIGNMINQYKTLADEAKTRLAEDAKQKSEYQKWANTVNEAMSKVKGYYVDGNGQAIVATDWKPVQIPAEAPMKPIFQDWYLITFSTDANGQIVAKPQKVMEQSDMDKINLALKMEELKGKQLENAAAQWIDITWLWGATWDLRYLADQFPWQAWAKNNNPAGITWNANFDNPKPWTTAYALQQAWVNFQKWTARPASEGWNYVTFPTIEDWLKAQQIMMTQTYWNKTVDQMLRSWVWTWEWPRYAQQVAWMAWVPLNVKVSQLTPEQLSTLQSAKIQKESPWLAKLLKQPAQTPSEPTPAEMAMFEKWAQYIWSKWWLSAARYNQIAEYQKTAWQDILNTYEPTFKNESQSKSFEYANRMIPSLSTIDNLESTWLKDGVYKKLTMNKILPDFLESSEYQQYDQAKRDFVNAVLRKESGATITDSEFANAEKQYFVQPWDKKEVIAQKKANREQALKWFMQTSWPWNAKYLEAVKGQYIVPAGTTQKETVKATQQPKTTQFNWMTPEQILQQYIK